MMPHGTRQRLTILRLPPGRFRAIAPWVIASLSGGLALAAAALTGARLFEGQPDWSVALNLTTAVLNLVLVFYAGTLIGVQRAVAAGVPLVTIQLAAADSVIRLVEGPHDAPAGEQPTRH